MVRLPKGLSNFGIYEEIYFLVILRSEDPNDFFTRELSGAWPIALGRCPRNLYQLFDSMALELALHIERRLAPSIHIFYSFYFNEAIEEEIGFNTKSQVCITFIEDTTGLNTCDFLKIERHFKKVFYSSTDEQIMNDLRKDKNIKDFTFDGPLGAYSLLFDFLKENTDLPLSKMGDQPVTDYKCFSPLQSSFINLFQSARSFNYNNIREMEVPHADRAKCYT